VSPKPNERTLQGRPGASIAHPAQDIVPGQGRDEPGGKVARPEGG
jgi:hypothetical protein